MWAIDDQLSPSTVIAPSPSLAKPTTGSDCTSEISSPTNGTCAEVSYITGVPTIISKDATTSSMTMLSSLMDRQITRTFLSSSRSPSQLRSKTSSPKTMGINVSQLRKRFLPKLDKDVKGSMSPAVQTEIEILRAQKKVTGGEIVGRLFRLGSLAPMASALKSLELRSDDSSALTDSCGPSTIGFSSPTQSSPPTQRLRLDWIAPPRLLVVRRTGHAPRFRTSLAFRR
ncbi:hypothetical protein EV363DRAFT_1346477 [Boletus edulis]|nr:hypothetical protein EV363DRAFT_1346477 [Boletus edulis]